MKTILARFLRDESGEAFFGDGFTSILVAVGCVVSLYLIMTTLGGVYFGVGNLPQDRHSHDARRDLFEQLQPFTAHAVFELDKSSGIASRAR
jgi:Flp pilus assembly pilin Flp